jgi:hypothetical protein
LGAALLVLALLAGCGGDVSGVSETIEPGTMTFVYGGAVSGAFAAEGAPLVDARARPLFGTWAAAGLSPFIGGKLVVAGFSGQRENEGVHLALSVPRVEGPATIRIDTNCLDPGCSSLYLLVGADPRNPHGTKDLTCDMIKGTLQITSISADRVAGTFSGEGFCVAHIRKDPFIPFTVQNGSFDVDIVEELRINSNAK